MQKHLKTFLTTHTQPDKPFLLGLSGGPDSIALFYLLLELKIKFGVAHIDHNWRDTSTSEALSLQKLAADHNIPFHLLTLNPETLSGNLENACRIERLQFFKSLIHSHNYSAVLLGHHLDDQAETVLKRVFEGASLPRLHGLQPVSTFEGLIILRPLLKFRKSEILKWLKPKNIYYIQDSTNENEKFMRARFRQKIIPYLNNAFGKQISEPLYRLGNQSFELSQYLEKAFSPYKAQIVKEPLGASFDFSSFSLDFEIKYLIRMFAEEMEVFLSQALIEEAASLIKEAKANKSIIMGKTKIIIDRKKMFILL